MKKIVLFDMDGTLTPARKKMEWDVLDALTDLQRSGYEIGVVTGSDLDYIKQQLDIAFDVSPLNPFQLHYLPCNGTKYYKMDSGDFRPVYEKNMREEMEEDNWRRLMQLLISLQSSIVRVHRNLPMAGNFISYRGSMINWCPIGRMASHEDRAEWTLWDRRQRIRENWLTIARQGLNNADLEDVVIKLGGDTSFDIYPEGWDKTFAFEVFKDYERIYFVGDRCGKNGNDREAYLAATPYGYSTTGPKNTIEIIRQIIDKGEYNG
jgi:phosphomannomutase